MKIDVKKVPGMINEYLSTWTSPYSLDELLEAEKETHNSEIQNFIGLQYAAESREYEEAFKWFLKAAKSHSKNSTMLAGLVLDNLYQDFESDTIVQLFDKAEEIFELDAENGNTEAKNQLGRLYYKGDGYDQLRDFEKAFKWWKAAADGGNDEALLSLGTGYYYGSWNKEKEPEYKKALEYWKKSAEKGNDEAAYKTGYLYYNEDGENFDGIPTDREEAFKWWKAAAEKGNMKASYTLGILYYDGDDGVEKNHTEAAKWFRKPAENDDQRAQNKLGDMYRDGDCVEQDYKEALKWYLYSAMRLERANSAATQDSSINSIESISKMYEEGKGVEKDSQKAKKWKKLTESENFADDFSKLANSLESDADFDGSTNDDIDLAMLSTL